VFSAFSRGSRLIVRPSESSQQLAVSLGCWAKLDCVPAVSRHAAARQANVPRRAKALTKNAMTNIPF
jgi:hypothetical protein